MNTEPGSGRILVVDDEVLNRDLFEQELEALGHRTRLAADGETALDILKAEPVDVVLLDIMMPAMDGFEVLQRLRDDPALRDVPVIVVSALHDLANTARGIELGAIDYLPKPFEPSLLKARIDACLERGRWRERERAYLSDLQHERDRADHLLHALLPREAVVELTLTGRVEPRRRDGVAVLFLDIVGFSELAQTLTPAATIEQLTAFTTEAERLAHAHALEKTKLVGDAVMLTGNLLVRHDDPVTACVGCARSLAAFARGIGDGWRLRGGLAFGDVVAGVIGRERFSFDLWGPTVNRAARLVGIPGPGSLHLDGDARDRLGAGIAVTPLGDWPLRGVGQTTVFHVDLETGD